jgi:8-oxo-dGTP pyrophosphatase MutT (NUDIX family)
MAAITAILRHSPKPFAGEKTAIARVRCVLLHGDRYLLAQHNSRRRSSIGQWGLPGGRLKDDEKPKMALRRELHEELGCRVADLVRLGDWLYRDEQQRVFGCEIREPIDQFDADELRAIGWFSYQEVVELAAARKLRMGFELAAIVEFRRRHSTDRR